ncbi:hypothetical protein GCM10010170_074380 [Dactylosporangium salmoneum]|uniref:Uncharacterized protein n=1 Tax=Dactylosporangium salmoneum TaxID=53361 RepID=A0ABN3H8J7_9ACTN
MARPMPDAAPVTIATDDVACGFGDVVMMPSSMGNQAMAIDGTGLPVAPVTEAMPPPFIRSLPHPPGPGGAPDIERHPRGKVNRAPGRLTR